MIIKQKSNLTKNIILTLSIILVAYGLFGLWKFYNETHHKNITIPSAIITSSTLEPEETKPINACDDYKVEAFLPRLITIDSIKVSGCVQRVGIDQHNAIAVPTNIHLAGWYINSTLPGDKGVSIIDGHVLGRYDDAIFAKLKNMQKGDIIRIQFGDSSWKNFETIDVNTYQTDEVTPKLIEPIDGVDKQLNLITCAGTYSSQSKTYDKRIIVRSKIVN